jgi:hypothetical protein
MNKLIQLYFELKRHRSIQPVFVSWHDGEVQTHALIFDTRNRNYSQKLAAIAHLGIAVKATNHAA